MIVFAINVHVGGGRVLLDELLLHLPFGPITTLFCDERYHPPELPYTLNVIRVQATLYKRWCAEFKLRSIAANLPKEEVLCFGNLPPLLTLQNQCIVYLQSSFLIPKAKIPHDKIKVKLRLIYEKTWFFLFKKNAGKFWVQTQAMRQQMDNVGLGEKTEVRPILPHFPKLARSQTPQFEFISVTSSRTQKRLEDLLEALLLLAKTSPTKIQVLVVTDRLTDIQASLIKRLKQLGAVTLEIMLDASRELVFKAYANSKCLVNTSDSESFCLPLYEAKHCGINIITCNEPYALEAAPGAMVFQTGDIGALAQCMRKFLLGSE